MGKADIPAARRAEIVAAARSLYEERGIDHTSVTDIAERAGITRSLFYHYFATKDDVTDAILDGYISTFMAGVEEWNANRVRGDVQGALDSCVEMLRTRLFDRDCFRADLLKVQNAQLYQTFSQHVAHSLAELFTRTTVPEYAQYHQIEIKHPYESFYLLIIGLLNFLRTHPDASDDLIADLIADTLHLDLESPDD